MKWISMEVRTPGLGEPLLIKVGGSVQHTTYMMDGADDGDNWFEPYFFDHDTDLKIECNNVTEWVYIDDI